MAALKNNPGADARVIEYATYKWTVADSGKVLRNFGDGWKISGRLKSGVTPNDAYFSRLNKYNRMGCGELVRKLRGLLGNLAARRWFFTLAQTLGDDYDGIWAEIQDSYMHELASLRGMSVADIAESVTLLRDYTERLSEQRVTP
jgi:hypothetical protein